MACDVTYSKFVCECGQEIKHVKYDYDNMFKADREFYISGTTGNVCIGCKLEYNEYYVGKFYRDNKWNNVTSKIERTHR